MTTDEVLNVSILLQFIRFYLISTLPHDRSSLSMIKSLEKL